MEEQTQLRSDLMTGIAKAGYILLSAALCGLGLVRLAVPELPAGQFSTLCGAILAAFGCIRLVGFCSGDLYRLAFQYDFEFGILILVLGVLSLLRSDSVTGMDWLPMGLLVLADGLFRIRITLEARRFGIRAWWVLLAIAAAASVLGGLLVLRTGPAADTAPGLALIAEGVLSFSAAVALVRVAGAHHT